MVAAAGARDLTTLADTLSPRTHASPDKYLNYGAKDPSKTCDALEGLAMSGEHVIESTVPTTPTRDIGIILSALKVENFEITTYKGLIQLANSLGKTDVANLFQQNLDDEVEASNMLTDMSHSLSDNQPS